MDSQNSKSSLHHIVIVGGGAGGLELATKLGDSLGRRKKALVTLIDRSQTHVWKPLLHEVAAGSMDMDNYELDYLAQAHWHQFRFCLGEMEGLNRAKREVYVAAIFDDEGEEILPKRAICYDTLVIAVGSYSNDFGTKGATKHAITIDTPESAALFHKRLINACLRANASAKPQKSNQLNVVIVGGGATGVELSAELRNSTRALVAYGFEHIDPKNDVKLTIVEAADRILAALPERLSIETARLLDRLGISVITNERVIEVTPEEVLLQSGKSVPAELVVWAAGIKAPEFLKALDGLEVNRINQLTVLQTLQTTVDPNIFALGDCACCPWPGHSQCVPPRAQAAHQQASHLRKSIIRRLKNKPLKPFIYRDFGSLVSLGEFSTVGNLMGGLTRGSVMVEGYFARLMYLSLYKMHELALHGFPKVFFDTMARMITRRTEPHVKLH